MCIIADNVKDVSKTKIACLHVGFTFDAGITVIPAQLTVYSANIDSQTNTNALILPVFNPGNNIKKIIPLDFSSESEFFDNLEMIYSKWYDNGPRNKEVYSFTNCFDSEDPILDVHTVGDYKFSIMPSKLDFNRLDRSQLNINPISKISIDMHNNDYSFIVYQFYEKGNINITPFGYLTECNMSNQILMVPTIHGHPHDNTITGFSLQPYADASHKSGFEETAHYDHEIYALTKDNEKSFDAGPQNLLNPNYRQNNLYTSDSSDVLAINKLLKKISTDYMKRKIRLYTPINFIPYKITIKNFAKNRNSIISKNNFTFINDLIVDLK